MRDASERKIVIVPNVMSPFEILNAPQIKATRYPSEKNTLMMAPAIAVRRLFFLIQNMRSFNSSENFPTLSSSATNDLRIPVLKFDYVVRKLAHLFEYALLGALLVFGTARRKNRSVWL